MWKVNAGDTVTYSCNICGRQVARFRIKKAIEMPMRLTDEDEILQRHMDIHHTPQSVEFQLVREGVGMRFRRYVRGDRSKVYVNDRPILLHGGGRVKSLMVTLPDGRVIEAPVIP